MPRPFTFVLFAPDCPGVAAPLEEDPRWAPGAGLRADLVWAQPGSSDTDRRWRRRYNRMPAGIKNALQPEGKRDITDKGRLWRTLAEHHREAGPALPPLSSYLPRTWEAGDTCAAHGDWPLVLKQTDSWGQRGVRIVECAAQLPADVSGHICQRLVERPLLWRVDGEGHKFHLRVHLLAYCAPAGRRVYMHPEAPVLTAARPYRHGDWQDPDVHLSGAGRNRTGRRLTWREHAEECTSLDAAGTAEAWASIVGVMRIVAQALLPRLQVYDECGAGFDLLAADLMVDEGGQAWLLEVNDRVGVPADRVGVMFRWAFDTVVAPHFGLEPWPEGEASLLLARR